MAAVKRKPSRRAVLTAKRPNLGVFIEWHGPGWQESLNRLVPGWDSGPDLEPVLVYALVAHLTDSHEEAS